MAVVVALLGGEQNLVVAAALSGVEIVQRQPLAVLPGQTVEMTFVGRGVKTASKVWATFPQTAERVDPPGSQQPAAAGQQPAAAGQQPAKGGEQRTDEAAVDRPDESEEERVTFRIQVPEETPAQLGALRIYSEAGVSSLQWVAVDDLATTPTAEGNQARETAQMLRLPTAVEGSAVAAGSLYYRFAARRGDTIRVEVLAARLGSPLDPLVRVLDLRGRAVASNDDVPGLAGDAQLACVIPADGDYLLQLRDIRYHGGSDHRFRLRVGRFPLVTAVFPLGVTSGRAAELELLPHVGEPRAILVEPDAGRVRHWVAAHGGRRRLPSSLIPALISDLEEHREAEPNDTRSSAQLAAIPSAVNGRFRHDYDQDWYRLDLAAGAPIRIMPRHGTLGVATRLYLELWGPDEKLIQKIAQTTLDTGVLEYTAQADGPHWLAVEELHRRFGHAFPYRIELRAEPPCFRLELAEDHVDVPRGGVFELGVKCRRGGYQGPVELELQGLGEGAEVLSGATIAKDKEDTALRVRVSPSLGVGGVQTFSVVGHGASDEDDSVAEPVRAVAEAQLGFRQTFGAVEYPPKQWRQSIGLGVGPEFPPFFQLAARPAKLWLEPGERRLAFEVSAERFAGFEGEIALEVTGIPEDVKIRVPPIAAKQPSALVVLLNTARLPAGDYPLGVVGSATHEQQPASVELAPLLFRVGSPLDLTATLQGELAPGKSQTVQVTVQRWTDDRAEVRLQWLHLPEGLTAAEPGTIAAGQESAELRLTATADAEVGDLTDVRLQGVTMIGPPPVLVAEDEPLAEFLTADEVAGKGAWLEAEDFDRGNVGVYRENYGEGIGIISDPGGQATNFAEYDLELPAEGKYRVELRYAAQEARPGKLILNGDVVKEDVLSQTTGGWMPDAQRWFLEGTFDFPTGKSVLRIESAPNMSHIDKILVVQAAARPTVDEPQQVTVESPPIAISIVAPVSR